MMSLVRIFLAASVSVGLCCLLFVVTLPFHYHKGLMAKRHVSPYALLPVM